MRANAMKPRQSTPTDYTTTQRPLNRRTNRPFLVPDDGVPAVSLKATSAWRNWPELTVKISGVHQNVTTYIIWQNFVTEGEISFIELFEGSDGKKDGRGKIRFSPPPKQDFWSINDGKYPVQLEDGTTHNLTVKLDTKFHDRVQSPIKKNIYYASQMKIQIVSLNIGILINPDAMMSLRKIVPIEAYDVSFTVDLRKLRITVAFGVAFTDPRQSGNVVTDFVSESPIGKFNRINRYMFQIPFGQLKDFKEYYRKRDDPTAGHTPENLTWSEFDSWYRQTDIVYDPYRLGKAKVTLQKDVPVIDIGRWTTYLFTLRNSAADLSIYTEIENALRDFNIGIVPKKEFHLMKPASPKLWPLINASFSDDTAAQLSFLGLTGNPPAFLPFEVRYQLEVCISRDILNEHNITKDFVETLAKIAQEPSRARNILEYITEQGKRIYNPMQIFHDPEAISYSPKTEIPHYCAYTRKATITPSTIYFSSPTVETTNRVLRHYSRENEDGRFLRVQFVDELFEGRINACADKQRNDEVFTRIYRTLFNGIQIGDRHYQFLAFGNSQFRENGAYFFCPTDDLSCDDIRSWMGSFSHINVVAKYAARLGQCFSTTRAINGLSKPTLVKISDIERNGYCFTDGVGKISPLMAAIIAAELGLAATSSAFQFRLGGCKGIVTVWPDVKDKDIHIRPSQQKFAATYNGLEIIRCARFSCATLNRQTITILSSLGVPDEVFLKMLTEQLADYQSAMSDNKLAQELLYRYIDDTQMTITIASMIRNGFMETKDPFVLSLLHLWRAWSIKLLKEKAKITVHKGAFVFGCIDETATLRGYTNPTARLGERISVEELPEIFLQVPVRTEGEEGLNKYGVIEGICLVGRNPSLHPGDLRVVRAVNVPALHHLRDVVVFPQNGDRDVPSMCSGGDLDGDDFFVLWDKELQPQEWNYPPMNYSAPRPKEQNRPVQITDLMKFFVRFMKNDALPTIAHAHMAQSDYLDRSVKDSRCIELAGLHSKAVDYVKSGQPAEMPKRLRPRQWPHFMEKKFKPKSAQYHSDKILGQLYDRVESVAFVPQWREPFDRRILRAYRNQLTDSLLKTVRQTKSQYDTAMRRILANQDIKTEFEVWSTFVLSKPRVGSDYKQQEEIARISEALKAQFRAICIERAGGREFEVLGPFVAGMYKVTKEEMDLALFECQTMKTTGERQIPMRKMDYKSMPLISFPWLFEKELGRIATGVEPSDDLGLLPISHRDDGPLRRRPAGIGGNPNEDFVVQDGAIIHRGEELDLFGPVIDDYDTNSESDVTDNDIPRTEHQLPRGKSGEFVLSQPFSDGMFPGHQLSGTGVEDVVPRIELDGLTSPSYMEKLPVQAPFLDTSMQDLVLKYGGYQNQDQQYPRNNTNGYSNSVSNPVVSYEDDFKEENVMLSIPASSLKRLEALERGDSENSATGVDVVEEVVEIQSGESAFERLRRMMDS